jgi:PhoH-like ATPase
MGPWMGALDDNLEVLGKTDTSAGEWGRAATNELIRSRIKIKSMNFMRGRTFLNKYVIIDEAQNLTPKQMKTLITRAGPGTKIICMGNLAQIDTPYLTEGSSGLTLRWTSSRAGRTAGTSPWRAANAHVWPTSPARCCNEWARTDPDG